MAKRLRRAQCVKNTEGSVAERKSKNCSRPENGEKSAHFGTESRVLPRVERAGGREGKLLAKEAVPEFCLTFAETFLQLVSREEKKKNENSA